MEEYTPLPLFGLKGRGARATEKRERMQNKLKITSSTLVNRDLLLPEMEKAHEIACTGFLAL